MTKIIGLTGGIGSGKTTISNYFLSLGIPVYIADTESKKLLDHSDINKQIREEFGDSVFENAKVSREKLAQTVFNDKSKLNALNAIIHPAVREHFERWLMDQKDAPIVIKEAAILFESGSYVDCDKIITVITPLENRIERVMLRDNLSRKNVLQRIQNQWTDAQRISKSDYIIENLNSEVARLQADQILKKLSIQ